MIFNEHGGVRRSAAAWVSFALLFSVFAAGPVLAIGASLPGSNFEIDNDANLKVDLGGTDWAALANPLDFSGPERRRQDEPTGQGDNSYKGGTKEDTVCPAETTGSIPNNKSDLLTFHVYEEPGVGDHPGFLNLAWSRVSDPSGTTLMDFEFNQSTTPCAQGPNVVRTPGDLLIEYAIDQGGARADISGRRWTGTEWGPSIDLDGGTACGGGPCAVGTINQTLIPATESDGLGEKQPRTFGEAQIDLRLIFDDQSCTSFGSAMLKSRSSDSFTSQLKDFIAPIPIDLQNCGNVIIRKQTDPDEDPNATIFGYTKDFATDPSTGNTFTLTDDQFIDFNDDVLFGSGYTVTEDVIPDGWDLISLDCTASSNVEYTVDLETATVTFAIDSDEDELDCTYTNQARAALTVVKRTVNAAGTFEFTSKSLTPASFSLTTSEPGEAGEDSREFLDLIPGTYDVAETTPPNGWTLTSATCDNGDSPSAVELGAGDSITCTFVNTATADLKITKITQDEVGTFDFTSKTLDPASFSLTTSTPDVGVSRDFTGIATGDYDVAETVPTGWNLVSATCDNGDDPSAITLGVGDSVECTFTNAPQRGAIEITKTRKHAALGSSDDYPHAGVTFVIKDGSGATVATEVTDQYGKICVDGLLLSQFAGTYTVTEFPVPSGYVADGFTTKDVVIDTESTCGDASEATVSFGNTPLTDISISVNSQVDGGTSTTVRCWAGAIVGEPDYELTTDPADPNFGDGTLSIIDLLPTYPNVTLTCQITVDP